MSKKRERPEHLWTLDEIKDAVTHDSTLFVDPGSEGTGWALFEGERSSMSLTRCPHATGVIKSNNKTWLGRINDIAENFAKVCREEEPKWIVIEWPELWSGDARSQAAAATGKLLQLAALCGALIEVVYENVLGGPLLITPTDWKGQLDKDMVKARIARALGVPTTQYPNHASDAVGMGLAVMGLL